MSHLLVFPAQEPAEDTALLLLAGAADGVVVVLVVVPIAGPVAGQRAAPAAHAVPLLPVLAVASSHVGVQRMAGI